MMKAASLDVKGLIPHRAPMLLVHRVVEAREDTVTCVGGVSEESPFVADGVASAVLALELAAQSAAVSAALAADPAAEPRVGFLAALRDVRFHVREIPAGRPLLATVRRGRTLGPLATYEASVTFEDGAGEILTATLSVAQGGSVLQYAV